jgi:sodium transport system ATP-binding protein
MQEVAALCDHLVILASGTVVAAGSAAGLTSQLGGSSLEDVFVAAVGSPPQLGVAQ